MPNDSLRVDLSPGARGEWVLVCTGPLTIQTLFTFREAVQGLDASHPLILDLTGVPYMDSAGLGTLVGAFVSGRRSGRQMVIAGAGPRIMALIRMSNLEQFFPSYNSRADAEAALSGAAPRSAWR